MREPLAPSEGWLLGTFATMIVCFSAATAYSLHTTASIDDAATTIAEDTSPSVHHLSAARARLRRAELRLDDYIDALIEGTRPDGLEDFVRSREEFHRELEAYSAVVTLPEERALWPTVRAEVAALDADFDAALARLRIGDVRGAREVRAARIHPAVERTSRLLIRLVDMNAALAHELAMKIRHIRQRSLRIAWALDGAAALLSALMALLLVRALRAHNRLQQQHSRLLEERAHELEELAGRVAHDLRGPLSAMSLAIQAARRQPEDMQRVQGLLARNAAAIQRADRLIGDLLAFARAAARPEPGARVDVAAAITELMAELRPEIEAANVEVRVESVSGEVACAPGILSSLLGNLLRNAIKYIGEGPERRVTIRAVDLDTAPAGRAPRRGMVRVEVEDTGPGIVPELQEKIFAPYVRAPGLKQPGIGLGLATVKRIVEAHRGTLGVRSAPGQGSVFWCELPKPEG